MSVTFVGAKTAGGWGAGSAANSPAFTPGAAGHALLVFLLGSAASPLSATGGNGETYNQVGTTQADGLGDFAGFFLGTSVSTASTTCNPSWSGFGYGDLLEYSGVNSSSFGGMINYAAPSGATISGSPQAVASGDVMVVFTYCNTAAEGTSYSSPNGGTKRDGLTIAAGGAYLEYAGSGGSLTPQVTVPNSAQGYAIFQIVLSASTALVFQPFVQRQTFVNDISTQF